MLISLQQLQYLADNAEVRDAAHSILDFLGQERTAQKLTNVKGFIYKKELVKKVFNGSKYQFQESITMYSNYDLDFKNKYAPYLNAQRIPIHLLPPFLEHIDELHWL